MSVQSRISEIPRPHESLTFPGKTNVNLPGPRPDFTGSRFPILKQVKPAGFIRLLFSDIGEYPEVETYFRELRKAYEEKVCIAYGQTPFETEGDLDINLETREQIAPRVNALRFL